MPEVLLTGCAPVPLLSYLKALGVFRLVATQADPEARLRWTRARTPALRSRLDVADLSSFLLEDYRPSPITSPWNAGAGYVETSAHREAVAALTTVEASKSPRTAAFRAVVAAARQTRSAHDPEMDKAAFFEAWRAEAPDAALDWLDAATVLTDGGAKMNPLLGTGGNDGRLDFSKLFIGCLRECVALDGPGGTGMPKAPASLDAALFGEDVPALKPFPVGQFQPGTAGMTNSSSVGTEPGSSANPWDVVLMFEGVLCFTGSVGRRLGDHAALFPFTCTQGGVMRVGVSLANAGDADVRGEVWLPTWSAATSFAALSRLLSEGRAQDDRRQARSGREMARATASLGVDRGINGFERVVLAQRFGRNFVGVPAGTATVTARPSEVDATRMAEAWVSRVRRAPKTPMVAALATLDRAEFDITRGIPGAFERWFLALRNVSDTASTLPALRESDSGVNPLDRLPRRVARLADDGSAEFRLARALAAVGRGAGSSAPDPVLRRLVEPVEWDAGRLRWASDVRCRPGLKMTPLALLAEVARTAPPAGASGGAAFADVLRFLGGRVDPGRVVRLGLCLSLCETGPTHAGFRARRPRGISRPFAAIYLAGRAGIARRPNSAEAIAIPARAEIVTLAARAPERATAAAVAHLRSCGLAPFRATAHARPSRSEASLLAAALAFPIRAEDRAAIEAAVLTPAAEPIQGDLT